MCNYYNKKSHIKEHASCFERKSYKLIVKGDKQQRTLSFLLQSITKKNHTNNFILRRDYVCKTALKDTSVGNSKTKSRIQNKRTSCSIRKFYNVKFHVYKQES